MIYHDGSSEYENSQGFSQDGAAVAELMPGCTAVARSHASGNSDAAKDDGADIVSCIVMQIKCSPRMHP